MDDSNDLNPWLYTAMLTGRGSELGDAQAFAVELVAWLVSGDEDDLNPQTINSQKAQCLVMASLLARRVDEAQLRREP